MPSTTFPTSVDNFLKVSPKEKVYAEHINHVLSAIPAVQSMAQNIITTDLHAWSTDNGKTIQRRTITIDSSNKVLTERLYGEAPAFRCIDVDGVVHSNNDSTQHLPVWDDQDYAVIVRGWAHTTYNDITKEYGEYDIQITPCILYISDDKKVARLRFTVPWLTEYIKYEIMCVSKTNEGTVRAANENIWLLDPEAVGAGVSKDTWLTPPYGPVEYVANHLVMGDYATLCEAPTVAAQTSYANWWVLRPGRQIYWPDWQIAATSAISPSAMNNTGDFGWSFPDYAYPLSYLYKFPATVGASGVVDNPIYASNGTIKFLLEFNYLMQYPADQTTYNKLPCHMRVYAHGYASSTTLSAYTTGTSATFYKQIRPTCVWSPETLPYYRSSNFVLNTTAKAWTKFSKEITLTSGVSGIRYLRTTIALMTDDPEAVGPAPHGNYEEDTNLFIKDITLRRIP